jgi:TonB family protein
MMKIRTPAVLATIALAAGCARPAASPAPTDDAGPVLEASQVDRAPQLVDFSPLIQQAPAGTLQGSGDQGQATVAVVVGANGLPERVMVVRATSSALEPAAERAARRLQFQPALLAGKPVRVRTEVVVQFRATAPTAMNGARSAAGGGGNQGEGAKTQP